jgi:hypothetical protein
VETRRVGFDEILNFFGRQPRIEKYVVVFEIGVYDA